MAAAVVVEATYDIVAITMQNEVSIAGWVPKCIESLKQKQYFDVIAATANVSFFILYHKKMPETVKRSMHDFALQMSGNEPVIQFFVQKSTHCQ